LFSGGSRRLAAGPAIDRELLAEHSLVGNQQIRLVLDHAADVVREPAVREGRRACFPPSRFGLLVQPAQAGRTRRAAGDASDDDHLHRVTSLPQSSSPELDSSNPRRRDRRPDAGGDVVKAHATSSSRSPTMIRAAASISA
jgi:hypothetical protein